MQQGNFRNLNRVIFIQWKFYNFFCRRHSLMNLPYNNVSRIMQHGNFRNLNRVIFT